MEVNEYGKIISKNLKRICYERQKTQADISRDLNISKTTVSGWFTGVRVPRMRTIDALCSYLRVKRSDIMEPYNPNTPKSVDAVKIPVLGTVAAGVPLEAVEEILDWEEIPSDMARRGEYFALRINGDSMSPRILNNDVVIVRQQPDVESGDIAIVRINGDEATCKRVLKQEDSITLVPFNPSYAPRTYSKKEIAELPIVIIGKVVELRGKF